MRELVVGMERNREKEWDMGEGEGNWHCMEREICPVCLWLPYLVLVGVKDVERWELQRWRVQERKGFFLKLAVDSFLCVFSSSTSSSFFRPCFLSEKHHVLFIFCFNCLFLCLLSICSICGVKLPPFYYFFLSCFFFSFFDCLFLFFSSIFIFCFSCQILHLEAISCFAFSYQDMYESLFSSFSCFGEMWRGSLFRQLWADEREALSEHQYMWKPGRISLQNRNSKILIERERNEWMK